MLRIEKKCKKCGEIHPIEDFPKYSLHKEKRRGICKHCRYKQKSENYYANREHYLALSEKSRIKHPARAKGYRLKVKIEVMSHYSKGKPKCSKCGFDDIRALAIDHINGDGHKHRMEISGKTRGCSSIRTYRDIRNNDYPDGFQVLCFNCNQIKECEQRDIRARSTKIGQGN